MDGHGLNDRDAKTRARRKARDGGEVGRKVSLIRYMPALQLPLPPTSIPAASFPVTKLPIPSGGKVRGRVYMCEKGEGAILK